MNTNSGVAPRIATLTIGRRVFTVRQAGVGSLPPFGALDLPLDGAQVSGAIAVGGWALDDLEVARVQIYRDAQGTEPAGVVFLGTAVFVPGARPDVQQAYPTTPLNHRAGFGFMILTNMLPNQGTGGFRIHAVARGCRGTPRRCWDRGRSSASTRTATQPFGTIDTPAQGETIAGSNYLNWGWALTPQPAMIPTDGSTIQVIVDGAPVGNPTYNLFRPDVSGAFPGLANTAGPVGYRAIDTTALAEGLAHDLVDGDRHASRARRDRQPLLHGGQLRRRPAATGRGCIERARVESTRRAWRRSRAADARVACRLRRTAIGERQVSTRFP